ncbi:DUF2567 domain-containing protein [Gordonia sp. L191]|uniref:DUF2567 domain-containing protein n=1 Tax=Gordonia sp. L191 TaxID=2982699 RepID=UPI0024BFD392|nr:DUF2567 domain-containing protein [Gordonia sp. L191]WHU49079.1 DUF2567 domain-containing protein [Gordonia sp. L191]
MTAPGPVSIGPRRRLTHRTPATLAACAAVIGVLGVVAGALWAVITPSMSALKAAHQVYPIDSVAGVSAFAFVMLGYGALAGVLGWLVAPGWRGLPGYATVFLATVLGSGIAGWSGTLIAARRFTDPDSVAVGALFRAVPQLWLDGATRGTPSGPWALAICAPLVATVVYLVFALANRHGDLGVGDAPPELVTPQPVPAQPGPPAPPA